MSDQPISLSRADRRKFEKAMRRTPRAPSASLAIACYRKRKLAQRSVDLLRRKLERPARRGIHGLANAARRHRVAEV